MVAEEKKILVIGLGRFGTAIAEDLWNAGIDVVVLDKDERAIDTIKKRSSAAFVGDATEVEVLEGIGVSEMDSVVVSFGRYFEASVLCVASLKQLEVPYIVGRAETLRQRSILKTVGASRVLQLESDMGKRFANELIAPVTQELVDFAEHYQVLPWEASGWLVGKTLGQARLRERYEINVIGYRRHDELVHDEQRPRLHIPKVDYEIQKGDTLLIVGEEAQVNLFIEDTRE